MINRSEKLSNIALEYPAGFGMVLAFLAGECLKSFDGLMGTFVIPTGIGVSNESFVEERVEDTIEGVVQESVAHGRFVDISRFRVGDCEGVVTGVTVGFRGKLSVEHENIVHQTAFEFLYIFSVSFSDDEFFPGFKQIFNRNTIRIAMSQSPTPNIPLSYPPPEAFACFA